MKEKEAIKNGCIDNGTGHRALVVNWLNGKLQIRRVFTQHTRERIFGWNASMQCVVPGDYVLMKEWSLHKETAVRLYRFKGGKLTSVRSKQTLSDILKLLPDILRLFLIRRNSGPSYLPPGPWREVYDMTERLTETTIRAFLEQWRVPGEWLDYIVQEAQRAPAQHLNTNWKGSQTKPLPAVLDNPGYVWESESGDEWVHNSMVWILITAKGDVTIHDIPETSGHRCVGPTRRIVETFTGEVMPMPKDVVRAIKVNLGAYEENDRSYGARWYLYQVEVAK